MVDEVDSKTEVIELEEDVAEASLEVEACTVALQEAKRKLEAARSRHAMLAQRLEAVRRDSSAKANSTVDWSARQLWSAELRNLCHEYFGVTKFRPNQEEALNALLSGKDVFLVMPTGAGKSICFQAPAMLQKKLTLVVSPLLALMHDQVTALRGLGVSAAMLSSAESKEEQTRVRHLLKVPCELRVLYVTPERVAKSKLLMSSLEKIHDAGQLGLVAIDEAHCISQWGHDFRPDYEKLSALKMQFRNAPLLALTATATPVVAADVAQTLGVFPVELRSPTNRPNLFYSVRHRPKAMLDVVKVVAEFIGLFPSNTPGIVYCFTRKDAENVCSSLSALENPVNCAFYHGELPPEERQRVQTAWIEGRASVIVATIAFGMGIHKDNVRFVIHTGLPASLHAYYQESGRAGRDGDPAACLLLYRPGDAPRHSAMNYYRATALKEIYSVVKYCQSHVCRRKMIAKHFGEKPVECAKGCDVCMACTGGGVEDDVGQSTPSSKRRKTTANGNGDPFVQTLQVCLQALENEENLTLLKLAEKVQKRCKMAGEDGCDTAQYVILALLQADLLREHFRHSPYATNAYLTISEKGKGALRSPESGISEALRQQAKPRLLHASLIDAAGTAPKVATAKHHGTGPRWRALKKLRRVLADESGLPGTAMLSDAELSLLNGLKSIPKEALKLPLPPMKAKLHGSRILACLQAASAHEAELSVIE